MTTHASDLADLGTGRYPGMNQGFVDSHSRFNAEIFIFNLLSYARHLVMKSRAQAAFFPEFRWPFGNQRPYPSFTSGRNPFPIALAMSWSVIFVYLYRLFETCVYCRASQIPPFRSTTYQQLCHSQGILELVRIELPGQHDK